MDRRLSFVRVVIVCSAALGVIVPVHVQTEPGYQIAFTSQAPRNQQVFLADADGAHVTPLAPSRFFDSNASFSPDGQWIVFTSTRGGSADLFRIRVDGSGLERLTDSPAFEDQAAFSADGRRIAFVSSRTGQADIWVLELETGRLVNVTNHSEGDFRPAWSPDGRWIAFSSDRDSTRAVRGAPGGLAFVLQQSTDIYIAYPDGTGVRRVTHGNVIAGSPSWSLDGSSILFYEADLEQPLQRGLGTTQIVSVAVATGERQILTSGEGIKLFPQSLASGGIGYVARRTGDRSYAQNSSGTTSQLGRLVFTSGADGASGAFDSPHWSRDAKRMVFHRADDPQPVGIQRWHSADSRFGLVRVGLSFPSYSPDGARVTGSENSLPAKRVFVTNADVTERRVLYELKSPEPCPAATCESVNRPVWSPRGDRIAFSVGAHFGVAGPAHLAMIRPDGTDLRMLTSGDRQDGLPSWSPDGRRLVFRTVMGARTGLDVIDIERGEITRLPTGSDYDTFPAWSPRGDLISFTSKRDGDYEIYVIRPDGGGLRRLTRARGNDAHSEWSPDGQWIAFSTSRQGFKDEFALSLGSPQPYGEICVMRPDGSDARVLTDNAWEEGAASWIPSPRQQPERSIVPVIPFEQTR
jgi:Tol biopolymer transport system component